MTDSVSPVIASLGLRAPRVALLVPGWGDWKLMVRAGIHAATTMWGGAGFVVVPVPSGDLQPAVIAVVRAYDPDSIVVPQGNTIVTPDEYHHLYAAQEVLSSACANYRAPTATKDDEHVASPNAGRLWASTYIYADLFDDDLEAVATALHDARLRENAAKMRPRAGSEADR